MVRNRDGDEVEVPPKDEEEVFLEKLVFGDLEGFEENLKKLDNLYDYSSDEEIVEESDRDSLDDSSEYDSGIENAEDEDLFFIDEQGREDGDDMEVDDESRVSLGESDGESLDESDGNVWKDSDDERLNVSLMSSDKLKKLRKTPTDTNISGRRYIARLRSQFERIYPKPLWVEKLEADEGLSNEDGSDDEVNGDGVEESSNNTSAVLDILTSNKRFVISKQLKLISPNKISITRLKDANYTKVSKSAIQSISFHHSHPLLLTGGFDRTLRIYNIDGKANPFLTSLHLRNSPITTCYFSPVSSKDHQNLVYAGGRRRYMNKWNLTTGDVEKISRMYGHEKFQRSMEYFKVSSKGTYIGLTGSSGWCNILDGITGQWVTGFKIEGTIIDVEFSADESFVCIANTAGEVWEFDMIPSTFSSKGDKAQHQNKIKRKFQDQGGIGITKIKLGGPKSRWLAIGSNNGIVNVYDRNAFVDNIAPKPIKCIENLVTSISSLVFSPDGQILCIASRAKRDALRLVHLPSCSVYSNWPTSGTPLGRVTAVAFSPNNEMLAIGNEGGKVTLWRLNHY